MSGLAAKVWATIVGLQTGRDATDGYHREKYEQHINSYNSRFDKSLTKGKGSYDEKSDAEKIKGRVAHAQAMTNEYYDLATEFYEYGWGQSFHFATKYKGESFEASIARHEYWLAMRLGIKKGDTVLDVGCGVGGPLRNIARFTGAKVIGLNNNEFQVRRANKLNAQFGVQAIAEVSHGDFMKIPFPAQTFDKVYAIEATCHAPDRTGCYKQVFDVLKEGGYFGGYEWCMTDAYDEKNADHRRWKHGIEEGNSLPVLTHYSDIIHHLKAAGFEVIEAVDIALEEQLHGSASGWWESFQGAYTLQNFKHTRAGRFVTNKFCEILEFLRIAPKGTATTAHVLSETGDALAASGESGIFTPMYFFLCRKPVTGESSAASSDAAEEAKPAAGKKGSKKK